MLRNARQCGTEGPAEEGAEPIRQQEAVAVNRSGVIRVKSEITPIYRQGQDLNTHLNTHKHTVLIHSFITITLTKSPVFYAADFFN